jgi:hypothetical protein
MNNYFFYQANYARRFPAAHFLKTAFLPFVAEAGEQTRWRGSLGRQVSMKAGVEVIVR